MRDFDITLLRAFVTVADVLNFTRAGVMLGATQAAVSIRISKLEDQIGERLFDRSPRQVRLTARGEAFLPDARSLLASHDALARRIEGGRDVREVFVGISDHVAGGTLPSLVAGLRAGLPDVRLRVTSGVSRELGQAFDEGLFDLAIVRMARDRNPGEFLYSDPLAWFAAPDFVWPREEPLPVIALDAPCTVREAGVAALEAAGIAFVEVFRGTGVAAVQAAVRAGLGVACLSTRNAPVGSVRLGPPEGLPVIAAGEVRLLHNDKTAALASRLAQALAV